MTHDIFISHASVDKEIADAMTEALEAQGIQCWIAPRDIRPGDTWGGSIVRAIESSKMMVIIFSVSSNASRQVLREVERAVQKDVVLLPFRIDDVPPSGDMEYFLSATHWLEALTDDLDGHLQELITISNSILNKPTSSDAANLGTHNAHELKTEPRIAREETSKAQHPTSSAVTRDPESNSVLSEELPAKTRETTGVKVGQSSPVKELKLEARKTPPGTKAKHSKPAKTKEVSESNLSHESSLSTSSEAHSKERKNSSTQWMVLLGLVSFAAIAWFISQQTNLLDGSESKPASKVQSSPKDETEADPELQKPKSIPAAEPESSNEANTNSNNSDSFQLPDVAPQPGEESSSEIRNTDDKPVLDSEVEVSSESQVASTDSQSNSIEKNSDGNQTNKYDENSKPSPSEAVQQSKSKPQTKPQSKPEVDEISALVNRANTGDLDAILELSERFLNGAGVERNELESVRLLEMVARSGSAFAQNKLASYYANGTIVPRNDELALSWYTLAAEQGDINSQYSLGEIYEFGFGTAANLAEAKKWYALAAEQGHMKARLFLKNFQNQNGLENQPSTPPQPPQINQGVAPEEDLKSIPES